MRPTSETRIQTAVIALTVLLAHGAVFLVGVVFAAIFVGVLLPAIWSRDLGRRAAAAKIVRLIFTVGSREPEDLDRVSDKPGGANPTTRAASGHASGPPLKVTPSRRA